MSRIVRRATVVVLVGVVAALVVAFATGQYRYVSTHGVSMVPTYHDGELVVVARSDSYHVGQIAAYRDPVNGVTVLHRIIGGDAQGWVFQGDNNESIDVAHPTSQQLIGRAVANVAGLGRVVSSPLVMGIGGAAAAFCVLGLLSLLTRRRPAVAPVVSHAAGTPPAPAPARGRLRRVRWAKVALIAADVLAVGAMAVALAFPVRHGSPPTPIVQHGTFRYEGTAPKSDTYPDGVITTGDSVFTRLTTDVTVRFDYSTDAPPADISGTVRLDLELSNRTGWRSHRELVPTGDLANGEATLAAKLDLAAIQALVDRVSEESGVVSAAIDIVVRATAKVTTPDAVDASTEFVLPLQLTPLALALDVSTAPDMQVVDALGGPVIVVDHPITGPATPTSTTGLVTDGMRRVTFFALLGMIALTIALWPEPLPAEPVQAPQQEPESAADPDTQEPSALAAPVTADLALLLRHERRREPRSGHATGSFPDGIACDGSSVWVANSGSNTVSQIDPLANTRVDHATGDGPRGIALDGTNVWVANSDSNTISRIHPGTGVRTDFPTGDGPQGVTHDGTHVWVTNSRSNTVSRIDPNTGTRSEYTVGPNPAGIAFDGWYVWVANFGSDTVSRIDPRELAPGGAVHYRVGPNPMGVAFDGQHIWVANFGGDTVSCLDPRDAAPGHAVHHTVGLNPRSVTWDGTSMWATNFSSGTVSKIDPDGAEPGTAVTYATGSHPCGISSDGTSIWVTNFSANTVSVIHTRQPDAGLDGEAPSPARSVLPGEIHIP